MDGWRGGMKERGGMEGERAGGNEGGREREGWRGRDGEGRMDEGEE